VAQTTGYRPVNGTAAGLASGDNIIGAYYYDTVAGRGRMQFDSTEKYSGNYSFKVSTTAVSSYIQASLGYAGASRPKSIPVLPSTSYTYSFWIKTQVNSGAATTGAFVNFGEYNGAGSYVTENPKGATNTTAGWTQYTGTFTTAATTRFVYVLMTVRGNDGTGTLVMDAWFDDITLTKTTPETRTAISYPSRKELGHNLIYNGDFEHSPEFTAATTTSVRFIDGTASGSTTDASYGWAMGKGGTAEAQFDTSVSHSGTTSLKLSTTATASYIECYVPTIANGRSTYNGKVIPVRPMTSYTYSFWMKTNYVSGDATNGAYAALLFSDAGGLSNGGCTATINTSIVKTTQDWTQYTGTFTTNAVDAYMQINLRIYGQQGTGTLIMDAWFDNITLDLTSSSSRTQVT